MCSHRSQLSCFTRKTKCSRGGIHMVFSSWISIRQWCTGQQALPKHCLNALSYVSQSTTWTTLLAVICLDTNAAWNLSISLFDLHPQSPQEWKWTKAQSWATKTVKVQLQSSQDLLETFTLLKCNWKDIYCNVTIYYWFTCCLQKVVFWNQMV